MKCHETSIFLAWRKVFQRSINRTPCGSVVYSVIMRWFERCFVIKRHAIHASKPSLKLSPNPAAALPTKHSSISSASVGLNRITNWLSSETLQLGKRYQVRGITLRATDNLTIRAEAKQLVKRLSWDLEPHCLTQTPTFYSTTHIDSYLIARTYNFVLSVDGNPIQPNATIRTSWLKHNNSCEKQSVID